LRILYHNEWDLYSLTESQEDASYPVENTQDIRLVKTWRTTTASAATVTIASGSAAKAIFQATTNLLEDSDDLTLWASTNATPTASGLYYDGSEFTKVTNDGATEGYIYQNETEIFNNFSPSQNVICRKGNVTGNQAFLRVYNSTESTWIFRLTIDFDNYPNSPGTPSEGTLRWYRWIDSQTVELHYTCASLEALTDNIQFRLYGSLNAIAGEYTYWMRPHLEDLSYDTPYVDGSRAAVSPTHAFEMPEMFIFKIKLRPWFHYQSLSDHRFIEWFIDINRRLMLRYEHNVDKVELYFRDSAVAQYLQSEQFDDGTTYDEINSELILFGAIRLDQQTGQRFFVIVDGVKQAEDTSFVGTLGTKSSTFPTVSIGHEDGGIHADSQFESVQFWAWDGSDLGTLDNEADIDAAMADKPTIFEQIYLPKIKANCAAILNHNLSPDATIGIRGNDYDSWNGLTAETMTWRADTIVTFITEASYPFWRFSITDPNVSDGYFEVGRFFLGTYLQVDPASLVEWPETHVRNDQVMFSKSNQLYGDEGVGWKELHYKFPRSTDGMKESIETMWGSCGKFVPLIFLNYDDTFTEVPPLYCVIREDIVFEHLANDFWKFELSLREVR